MLQKVYIITVQASIVLFFPFYIFKFYFLYMCVFLTHANVYHNLELRFSLVMN